MNVPLTPVLTGESPARQKRLTPVDGPVGVTPTKVGGSSPRKTTGGPLPNKATAGPLPNKMTDQKRTASPKDDNEGCVGSEASAQDGEDREDDGLNQGEEEVDEMQDDVTSEAPTRRKTQVAIEDQKTYILAAGKWAGLGAIRKVNEVCVNVCN